MFTGVIRWMAGLAAAVALFFFGRGAIRIWQTEQFSCDIGYGILAALAGMACLAVRNARVR